jgi:hypothetical protein
VVADDNQQEALGLGAHVLDAVQDFGFVHLADPQQ